MITLEGLSGLQLDFDKRRLPRAAMPDPSFVFRMVATEVWDYYLAPLGIWLDAWQRRLIFSMAPRIALCCSRQVGKSTAGAILALKTAVVLPRQIVLLVSPSLRQSSELFRKVTMFLEHLPLHKPTIELNRLSLKMRNGSRIISLPSSEQTIRGFSGVNLIIEDEASRVNDELYYAIRPMLAASNGRLVVMSTPAGKRGHFWQIWSGQTEESWERYQVTAHDCPRISKEFLENERKALGDLWFRQEYECEFIDAEGQLFRTEDLEALFEEHEFDSGQDDQFIEMV